MSRESDIRKMIDDSIELLVSYREDVSNDHVLQLGRKIWEELGCPEYYESVYGRIEIIVAGEEENERTDKV